MLSHGPLVVSSVESAPVSQGCESDTCIDRMIESSPPRDMARLSRAVRAWGRGEKRSECPRPHSDVLLWLGRVCDWCDQPSGLVRPSYASARKIRPTSVLGPHGGERCVGEYLWPRNSVAV